MWLGQKKELKTVASSFLPQNIRRGVSSMMSGRTRRSRAMPVWFVVDTGCRRGGDGGVGNGSTGKEAGHLLILSSAGMQSLAYFQINKELRVISDQDIKSSYCPWIRS